MKRYSAELRIGGNSHYVAKLVEHDDGAVVLYEDAMKDKEEALKAQRNDMWYMAEKLESIIKRMKDDYKNIK